MPEPKLASAQDMQIRAEAFEERFVEGILKRIAEAISHESLKGNTTHTEIFTIESGMHFSELNEYSQKRIRESVREHLVKLGYEVEYKVLPDCVPGTYLDINWDSELTFK